MSKDELKYKEKISKKLGIADEPINETDKYNNDILGYIIDKYKEKFSSTNIRDKMKEIDCAMSIRLGNVNTRIRTTYNIIYEWERDSGGDYNEDNLREYISKKIIDIRRIESEDEEIVTIFPYIKKDKNGNMISPVYVIYIEIETIQKIVINRLNNNGSIGDLDNIVEGLLIETLHAVGHVLYLSKTWDGKPYSEYNTNKEQLDIIEKHARDCMDDLKGTEAIRYRYSTFERERLADEKVGLTVDDHIRAYHLLYS